jgi:hypothetical protein
MFILVDLLNAYHRMKISDLQPDKRNARRASKRSHEAVEHSLRNLGAGRSILLDSQARIIAGNTTAASAAAAGIEDMIVVQTDGTKLIAVQRTDLDLEHDAKAKQLQIADNRSAEFAEWNPEVLAELSADLDLKPFFSDAELAKVLGQPAEDSAELPPESFGVLIENLTEQQQLGLLERLSGEGLSVKAMTL